MFPLKVAQVMCYSKVKLKLYPGVDTYKLCDITAILCD